MPRWCACYHTAPAARCKACPLYRTPRAEKGTCGAHAVLNSNDPATRQDVWCPLPYAHNGQHQPTPMGSQFDSFEASGCSSSHPDLTVPLPGTTANQPGEDGHT